ncbi:MAG: hypothetical protein AAB768_02845 [Patescibacteria group bacterium]
MRIIDIRPKTILSSMGNETVEVTLFFSDGQSTASVPAGISAGQYEIQNVTVSDAITQIENIKNKLINIDFVQESLDKLLVEENLAGNASLPISAAFWKFDLKNKTYTKFPKLFLLLFEGGKHGNSSISIQEFAIIENRVEEAISNFKSLKDYLDKHNIESLVGAEGGFSPKGFDNSLVLETIKNVFPDKQIAIDIAATFANSGIDEQNLLANYNIASIEDPYPEDAWPDWVKFYKQFGNKILVVGDDLIVTNKNRLNMALNPQAVNAIIVKPNQNGTISGALEVARLAKENNLKVVVSHRGEETDDSWIVDFALEAQADFVKFGGMDRGERIAKYNRLRELGMV